MSDQTPQALAWKIVAHLGSISGVRVLEPSAGAGSLANAAREYGGIVTCIETEPRYIKALQGLGHDVCELDFLRTLPQWLEEGGRKFDCIVMRPPEFRWRAHLQHAYRMFLSRFGTLVAVVPMFYGDAAEFRDLVRVSKDMDSMQLPEWLIVDWISEKTSEFLVIKIVKQ